MESLAKSGWHVSADAAFESTGAKEVATEALNRDIKDFGDAFVQDLLANLKDNVLETGDKGHVLQVGCLVDKIHKTVRFPETHELGHPSPNILLS